MKPTGDETQGEWVAAEDQELKQNIIGMLKESGIKPTPSLVAIYIETCALAVILEKFDSASANPTVGRC
jgi:hypothetical protein